MSMRTIALAAALLTAVAGLCTPVRAQAQDTVRTVRGRVVLIAGADLHLELSASPRLEPGDTLVLRRAAAVRGELVVVAADSARAVVRFAGAPFALTRGQELEAELRRDSVSRAAPAPAQPTVPVPAVGPVPSVAKSSAAPGARRAGMQASGYVTSETRWIRQRTAAGTESYGIPSSTLALRVENLPGHASLHVFAHGEHYGGRARLVPGSATRVRVYAARIESAAGPLRIGIGRITSLHDPFGGPWDGIAVEAGRQLSVAAAAGWEPEQGTGAPSTRFPRVSLSAQAHGGIGATAYRGTLSALRYLNDAPVGRGTTALATRHSLTAGPLSLSGDVVAESSASGSLALRWGGLHAALGSGRGGRVHVTYRRYHPQRLGSLDTLADLTARHRVEAGGYVPIGRAALSVTAATTPRSAIRTLGATSHLYVRGLPADLEADVSGGLWRRAHVRSVNAGVGLARNAGRFYTRAAYRMERGAERTAVLAHEIESELSMVVARRSWISALAVHSSATTAAGTHLELRLTWGF